MPRSTAPGRRVAERPRRRAAASSTPRWWRAPQVLVGVHVIAVAAGVAALTAATMGIGPDYLDEAGAVLVSTAFTWILAARVGGRPIVFGTLAAVLGTAAVYLDRDVLRTGAAVMTVVVAAVLAVMATVPAVRFYVAVQEVLMALGVAALGGFAAIGFQPVLDLARFEYATLALSMALALALVYRLGAGFHGLGRRGLAVVVGGGLVLAVLLVYAELLRRYGTPALIESALDGVRWGRAHLGAFPRPLQALLGIPALAWGCHQRARRRQGWWATAFGVAATVPVTHLIINPAIPLAEVALVEAYTLVVGLMLGYTLIRLDLALTGSRGRRGRRAEAERALRPEPPRTRALL